MWQCSYCIKQYKYESEKNRHENSHFPQFECKVCAKKFSFRSALRRHEKQHERTGAVQCSKCGGQFRDEALLKRHIQYAHKGTFTCKKCSAQFRSEAAMNNHMKIHQPVSERRFRCSYASCSKSFNFSHHLKHHLLTHTDDKQHFCCDCGKGFIQTHHLKAHMKTHQPDEWISCSVPECKKMFINEYARKRHLATHRIKDTSVSSPDSRTACDMASSTKEFEPLSYSGELITKEELLTHSKTSLIKEQTEPEDLSFTSLSVSIKEISDNMDKDFNLETDQKIIDQVSYESVGEASETNNMDKILKAAHKISPIKTCKCKQLLNDVCIESDDQKEDCFCEQVTKNNYYNEATSEIDINNLQIIKLSDEFKTDDYLNNGYKYNKCDGCECASLCSDEDKAKEICNFDGVPELEFRTNGVVKIKEIFDVDIARSFDNNNAAKIIESNNVSKLGLSDMKCFQYNTCEDVLGKCIVTGTGNIEDECLCAKMSADNQQMIAQEIEELTPCPKKNTWFNIKYKVRL